MGIWKLLRCGYNNCRLLTEGHWLKLETAHGHFKQIMVVGVED